MTSGKSMAESERHSVPLSAAALPTDCGDWEPESVSDSGHCLEPGSDSLWAGNREKRICFITTSYIPTILHDSLRGHIKQQIPFKKQQIEL